MINCLQFIFYPFPDIQIICFIRIILGTFYLTCECQKGGADKESDFNVNQHLKALHIRFLPDQTAEDNLSSREFIKKAEFVNIKSLLSGKTDEEGDENEGGGSSTGSGTEGGGSDTPGGGDDNGGAIPPGSDAPEDE